MFLCVANRPIVIIGGDEQAAQKCRLVLKTEAEIVVAWHELSPELVELEKQGRISWHREAINASTFNNAALVFIAIENMILIKKYHQLAIAAGAVVNVVDQPELCTGLTPSIVDRDPVVVAIGTEGTAPVLARNIKSQIEIALEPELGKLAKLGGQLREAVANSILPHKRRSFWKWVFSDAPRRLHAQGNEQQAAAIITNAIKAGGAPENTKQGEIILIDTSHGTADLLTLRAMKRLQEADIIFYSKTTDAPALEIARRDAERVYTAKRLTQELKGDILVAANQGKTVVWLNGRIDRLEQELMAKKIRVEIVPSVTIERNNYIPTIASPNIVGPYLGKQPVAEVQLN